MNRKSYIAILNALLSDCKRSDREIANMANVSQPTVSRARQRLEKAGTIKAYMAIPDYAKLGFPFGAIITGQFPIIHDESIVVSASTISGDTDVMLVTLHKTIEDHNAFLNKIKAMKREGSSLNVSLFTTHGLEIKPVQAPEN